MANPNPVSPITQAIRAIEARSGLSAGTLRRAEITQLLNNLSGGDLPRFVERLAMRDLSSPEWQAVFRSIAIGETYFMRDSAHFKLLREHILPQITMQRREQRDLFLRVWCAGCSTGEEAYSVAITLFETLPDLARWRIDIIGSDVNLSSLEAARRARYRRWSFRQTPDGFRGRYFQEEGDLYKLSDEIRPMVRFEFSNLLDKRSDGAFDLIFCRHVMLYFSEESVNRAEEILFQTLRPGGWLLLGQAEALRFRRDQWTLHLFPGSPLYQRPLAGRKAYERTVHYHTPHSSASYLRPAPEPSVEDAYKQAVEAIHNDQVDSAEQSLARVLAYDPQHARAHTVLALLFANRRAIPEARSHLERALRYEPLLADAHYVAALLHNDQADTAAAQGALQSALYCERGHILASFMLGEMSATQGDLQRAYRHWQRARTGLGFLAPDAFISDLSDLRAGVLDALLRERLDENEPAN